MWKILENKPPHPGLWPFEHLFVGKNGAFPRLRVVLATVGRDAGLVADRHVLLPHLRV